MAYSTYTELQQLTGSEQSQSVLEAIIAQSDREIDMILAKYDLSGSGDTIKSASLELSIAGVLTRQRMDGTQPDSLNVGQLAMGLNTHQAIDYHRKNGLKYVDDFIAENIADKSKAWVHITNKR